MNLRWQSLPPIMNESVKFQYYRIAVTWLIFTTHVCVKGKKFSRSSLSAMCIVSLKVFVDCEEKKIVPMLINLILLSVFIMPTHFSSFLQDKESAQIQTQSNILNEFYYAIKVRKSNHSGTRCECLFVCILVSSRFEGTYFERKLSTTMKIIYYYSSMCSKKNIIFA